MGREGPCTKLGEMGLRSCNSLAHSWKQAETALNRSIAGSKLGCYFKLDARKTTFTKELRAGTATFLTMAYIISVNAAILIDSGGPCTPHDCTPHHHHNATTPNPDCRFHHNPGYERCLSTVRKDLVVATVLTSMLGSFFIGALANLPFAVAPGMGANAYFAYNMVGYRGSGPVPYPTALAAVMLEGLLFLALSALGLRGRIARLIPRSIRLASAAGMGLFLAFTGLQSHVGVGLVGPSPSTLVTLAACTAIDPVTGACVGGTLRSPTFWLSVVGFLITAVCLAREIKGSMIYGIVFVTLVSWIRGTSVTFFPDDLAGNFRYQYFRKTVDFHVIKKTMGVISFAGFHRGEVWAAVATLLYVDVLDTTGSMYSMAEYAGLVTEEEGNKGFEGEYRGFIADASATIVGSALGTTTCTTYLESAAGIKEGGRTGLTAVVVGVWFMGSLFLTPVMASVPAWAVGQALVVVGAMMMGMVKEVEWTRMEEAVPAFVTLALMPMTYSVANGIVAGVGVYVVVHLYEYVAAAVRWGRRIREMMAEARNQVSAASADVLGTPMREITIA